jgi:hypothetical protein
MSITDNNGQAPNNGVANALTGILGIAGAVAGAANNFRRQADEGIRQDNVVDGRLAATSLAEQKAQQMKTLLIVGGVAVGAIVIGFAIAKMAK